MKETAVRSTGAVIVMTFLRMVNGIDYRAGIGAASEKQKWLVRRYRHALRGDRRNWREQKELQEELRVPARGIQQACAALLGDRMNELARRYRENKAEIDNLRWQLSVVRKPMRK